VDGILFGTLTAFWLGVMTSLSPCPLATNIAAISFVGRNVENTRRVLWAGLLYTAGRTLAYLALGMILVTSLLSAPAISHILQKNMNQILGPLLILVGMFLLELLRFSTSGSGMGDKAQRHAGKWGIWGAGLLGILFALSFCPVSAALFFGSLIPLGVKNESGVLLPIIYGIGTGLPVLVFAILIALGTRYVGTVFNKLAVFEKWLRRVTGVVFILVGIYYSLTYIFRVNVF